MKKSAAVPLTLVASFASALACSNAPEVRQCVDAQQRVVPDSLCAVAEREHPGSTAEENASRRDGSGALLFFPYRYYYGGSRASYGTVVGGGGFFGRSRGGSFGSSHSSGVSRGGFGGIGAGHGIGG